MVVLGRKRLSKRQRSYPKLILNKWKVLLVIALPLWVLYRAAIVPLHKEGTLLLFVGHEPEDTVPKVVPNSTRKNINIFYHTFSGPTNDDVNLARKIVAEQLEILGQASRRNNGQFSWILRYRTVGENSQALGPVFLDQFCTQTNNLHCEFLGHDVKADEDVTLQQLYEFCLQHPTEVVVYLHSKGSYHDHEINRHWRAPLTSAAVHSSCIDTLYKNQSTTCGLQFYPLWVMMYPGNIWSAQCSHVQKLLPPLEYRRQLAIVANISRTETSIWKHGLYHPRKDHLGVDRFANEHWVTSHPDTKPYDLFGETSTLFPYLTEKERREAGARQLQAMVAPRIPLSKGDWIRFDIQRFRELVAQDGIRPHDYFLLPGIVFRFYKIYGSFPQSDSWIWKYYPHGKEWREKVDRAYATAHGGHPLNESIIW